MRNLAGAGQRPGGCLRRVHWRLKDKGRREWERHLVRQTHNLVGLGYEP